MGAEIVMLCMTIAIIWFACFLVFKVGRIRVGKPEKGKSNMIKKIKETKCICQACGNVWYYGKQEEREIQVQNMKNCGSAMSNTGSDLMCCGGCLPAAVIPKEQAKEVKDLNKCPKCNSSAIKKEEIVHEI